MDLGILPQLAGIGFVALLGLMCLVARTNGQIAKRQAHARRFVPGFVDDRANVHVVGLIASLVGAMIAILIGVNLVSPVANGTNVASNNADVKSFSAVTSLLPVIPIVFVAIVILIGIGFLSLGG